MTTASHAPTGVLTTEIGSLPHSSVDAALEQAFGVDIPFLPQIPLRNPGEYMIAQALEGMPGLEIEEDGNARVDYAHWITQSHRLDQQLEEAFARSLEPGAFERFEPSPGAASCWRPFLWELEERKIKRAKIQLAGPITCQWALRLTGEFKAEDRAAIARQIARLCLARSLALCQALQSRGIEAIFFLDEPALYGLNLKLPRHWAGFQEFKLFLQTLRQTLRQTLASATPVQIGIHCCSNTDWEAILGLPLDFVALDAGLSLEPALASGEGHALPAYLKRGGHIALGAIPTTRTIGLHQWSARELWTLVAEPVARHADTLPGGTAQLLEGGLLTPACGLAFRTIAEAEDIRGLLAEIAQWAKSNA